MRFLRNFVKNKVLVLSVCVIVLSLVYTVVQKTIDNYNFKTNNELVEEENSDNAGEVLSAGDGKNADDVTEEDGQIDEEETNLELEGSTEEIEGTNDSGTDTLEKEVDNSGDGELLEESKIYIYITGEVNAPGVVVLNEGSRIVDAINAAGGTTAKADISKVNLVYVLDDGMKVNIPNSNDLKNNPNFEYITMKSGDGGNDDYYGDSSSLGAENKTEGSTGGKEPSQGSSESGASGSGKRYDVVNINTASQTELETLPGIGPSLALKIINHRKENGKFSSIEQIKDVSGIGESKFENLKKYITI